MSKWNAINILILLGIIAFLISFIAGAKGINDKYKQQLQQAQIELTNIKNQLGIAKSQLEVAKNKTNIFKNKDLIKDYIIYENYKVYPELADLIVNSIFTYANQYDIDPTILLFMIKVESDFDVDAVSHKGAIGLMQITPSIWVNNKKNQHGLEKIGITKAKQLYNPEDNIHAGTYILSYYLTEQCDMSYECALKKYFGGDYKSYVDKIKYTAGDFYFFAQGVK